MNETTIRVTTSAHYRGLAVTVLGDTRAGLLAVAGYGTPQEIAIAAITVKRLRGQRVYRVAASRDWTPSLDAVAHAAVTTRQARRKHLARHHHGMVPLAPMLLTGVGVRCVVGSRWCLGECCFEADAAASSESSSGVWERIRFRQLVMAAPRPTYAPASPRAHLPRGQRLGLRLRRRARRQWTVQALLDERAEMLETLTALEQARRKFTTKTRERLLANPSALDVAEKAIGNGEAKFDQGAEIVRHRLLLGDSILSSRGVRPWMDEHS